LMLQQKRQGNCCTAQNSGLNSTTSRAFDNNIEVIVIEILAVGPLNSTQRSLAIAQHIQEIAGEVGGLDWVGWMKELWQ
jgi:hypothetical protein